MKKNIFCLVVDALSFPYMNDKYNAMPFLRTLQEKGHNCVNMYSQGPYTEAALTPFYTGRDNMDFGGNFFRGQQASQMAFEVFDNNGFDVLNYTQPLIYPKPMHRGVNNERYGVCYFFSAVWDYRLSHFAELHKRDELTGNDYDNIIELVESNLEFWIEYLGACKNNKSQADFINLYADTSFDFDMCIDKVTNQYNAFLHNKKQYIEDVLKLGEKHEIFEISNYFMTSKSNNTKIYNEIKNDYKSLFKKIESFNQKHNKSQNYSMKALLKVCLNLLRGHKEDAINGAKKYHYHKRIRSTKKELANIFKLKSNYKPEPTILKYFEHFCKWYGTRDGERPFYCMMHISDLHTPEIFFSIDSDDLTEVKKELSAINVFINSLPINFDGNIMYWLSMRYVDLCIERMFKWFQKNDMMQSTLFLITADHASSFGFRPIRTSLVNNEHDENYHIPCIFLGNNIEHYTDERFLTTKDMVKTLLEYSGLHSDGFTGHNIFDYDYDIDYAITEYLGAGCPDIARKPIEFVIRDKTYSIGFKQLITDDFSINNVCSVYNRKNDSEEKYNIKCSIDFNDIKYLINKLELRFRQIQGEYYAN